VFNYLWIEYQAMLGGTVHVPADRNHACDDLSRDFMNDVAGFRNNAVKDRNKPVEERLYNVDHSMVGDRSAGVELEEFMGICNPSQIWETQEDFSRFWVRMKRWCCNVLGDKPSAWVPSVDVN
jgi:hypothetical protein